MSFELVDRAFVAVFFLGTVAYLVHILNVLAESGAIAESSTTGLAVPLGLLTTATMVWSVERVIVKTAMWGRLVERLDEVRT